MKNFSYLARNIHLPVLQSHRIGINQIKKLLIPKIKVDGDTEDVPNTTDRLNTSNNEIKK